MNLKKWIDDSEDRRRKTDYYLSLGYSEHAAAVLSSVTYGDDMLVFLVKQIGGTSVIENLYQWLSEREEISPDEAILAYYSEKHHRPKFSGGPRFSAVMGSIEAAPCSAPFADVMPGLESDDEESFAAPSMACSAPTAAPHGNPGVHTRKLAVALSTDEYESIEEKSAKSVFTSPTSTFRMTTSNASMGIVMNQLRSGRRVSMDQVRIEEVLNYFDYDAPAPHGREVPDPDGASGEKEEQKAAVHQRSGGQGEKGSPEHRPASGHLREHDQQRRSDPGGHRHRFQQAGSR